MALLLAASSMAAAPGGPGAVPYLEAGMGRRQGDFGTAIDSTLWLGYGSVGCFGERWDANLTVPVLGLERAGTSGMDRGLGDAALRGGWRFVPETWEGWSLDGLGVLKLPTARQEAGLGTGRADLGAFLALNQQLGLLRWTLLGGWVQGVSGHAGGDLTAGAYLLGASTALALEGGRWELGVEARGPSFQGSAGTREAFLGVSRALSPTWEMRASVLAGLTDASSRWGLGFALVRTFP